MKSLVFTATVLGVVILINAVSSTEGSIVNGNTKKSFWKSINRMPAKNFFGRLTRVGNPEEDKEFLDGWRIRVKNHLKCPEIGSFPMPNECTKYLECQTVGVGKIINVCPEETFFDHLQRKCLPTAEAKCRDLCRYEGEQYPDPLNTAGFLRCHAGVLRPQKCEGENKKYDATKKKCLGGNGSSEE